MKLTGITVLDLSLFLPGPTVSQMMADHGARVIKVENTGEGEPNRHIGQTRGTQTVYFACTHRGKESLSVNLKDARGLKLFRQLASQADVIIESFRPGVVARLGIDYESIQQVRPDIVYAAISAYGQSGPLVSDPAHDLAVEYDGQVVSDVSAAEVRKASTTDPRKLEGHDGLSRLRDCSRLRSAACSPGHLVDLPRVRRASSRVSP